MGMGRKIAELRLLNGWSQKELAKRVLISPSYISRIEEGNIPRPRAKTLARIADALGVKVGELYEEDQDK